MDPALREYLDRMELNANARSDAIVATQQGLSKQIETQTAQLRDLAEWRPDLETRLANLTDAVADLQRARSAPSATEGGSAAAHLAATAPASEGAIHVQPGHGEQHLTGGFLPLNSGSPMVPPVTAEETELVRSKLELQRFSATMA